ncbi:hypothetical protein [Shimia sagamensis]|uniref:Secreted protein n=1 Tax=Shimia sagamensis TaxID=1566352 RepID=A0ABY1NUS5_9RHOB|nr:hypothetical protein [Shimia sagamensis]SMP18805.1 hypothetical protein SAMN06265373_103326 [Shimia sagamensis]
MFTKFASAAVVVALTAPLAFAYPVTSAPGPTEPVMTQSYEVADTVGMDNRDDRRGDRQDCRQVEGVAGSDKRDCKQDSRNG